MKLIPRFALLVAIVHAVSPIATAATVDELVATIRSVAREGKGNAEVQAATKELMQADAAVLPTVLKGFQDANPLAMNWLRGAVESIADRSIKQGEKLPVEKLEAFILNRKHNPRARRLAYEWLVKVDKSAEDRLIPGMIDDPSHDLRRDAVARLIDQAHKLHMLNKNDEAGDIYLQAFAGAVDNDQVKLIVDPLRKLGRKFDMQRHFGFITHWQMIGPFNNRGGIGFEGTYLPELEIELEKTYDGQLGDVAWKPISTDHDYGIFDIAKQISPYKGAVMYAYAEFYSPEKREIELRLGTPNAWMVWVNEKKVFEREEYHRGMALDQFRMKAVLKPGRNAVLLKLCQDEKTYDWAQRYQFQFRVCDHSGAAVLSLDNERVEEPKNEN